MKYCYILKSLVDNSYYIGSTNNIEVRLKYHNSGRSRYTKTKRPWVIIHLEEFDNLVLARKREKQIKSWHSRVSIERLLAPSSSG